MSAQEEKLNTALQKNKRARTAREQQDIDKDLYLAIHNWDPEKAQRLLSQQARANAIYPPLGLSFHYPNRAFQGRLGSCSNTPYKLIITTLNKLYELFDQKMLFPADSEALKLAKQIKGFRAVYKTMQTDSRPNISGTLELNEKAHNTYVFLDDFKGGIQQLDALMKANTDWPECLTINNNQ